MTTIADVARSAGVSPVTVSRVINGAPNVRASTRAAVEQAIADLHYVPSVVARSLRSKRTYALALVVPDITNPFWTTVARGVEDAAQNGNYSVLLCNTDENPAKQHRYLDMIVSQRVDGVIIAPYDSDAQSLVRLRERNIPTVVIDRRINGWNVDTVYCDSIASACALARHLIGLGHTRIALITGPKGASTAEDRLDGYCHALDEAGLTIDPTLIKRGEYRAESGFSLMEELLNSSNPPTAVVTANNLIAIGAFETIRLHKLSVPQDIALVTFDDLPDISRFFPFFTVISQPAYEMGQEAARLLLERLDAGNLLETRCIILPTRLVARVSCGRMKNGLSVPVIESAAREEVIPVAPLENR